MIEIAAGSVGLRIEAPAPLESAILEPLHAFVASADSAASCLTVHVEHADDTPPYGDSVDVEVDLSNPAVMALRAPGGRAWFDHQASVLTMHLDLRSLEQARGAWENMVRRAVQHLLLSSHRGALFHAASFEIDDVAVLALGPSGRGKSTLALHAARHGCTVYSDDLSWLDMAEQSWMVCGSPFFGLADGLPRRPGSKKLGAVFVLEQAETPAIRDLTRSRAVASLIANLPFSSWTEPHHAKEVFSHLERLARSVPVATLSAERAGDATLRHLREWMRLERSNDRNDSSDSFGC